MVDAGRGKCSMYFNERVIPLSALLYSLDKAVAWDIWKRRLKPNVKYIYEHGKKPNEIVEVKNN